MGVNDEDTIFLTQDEQGLYMLQQLQVEYGESFDYKQGYDSTIFKVHEQYNMRSKRNADFLDRTKKTMQNQPQKIKESPVSKILQILPRQNPNPSSPKIVDITPNQAFDDQPSTSIPLVNPWKEIPNKEKENDPTQIPPAKTQNLQLEKASFPFNG